MEVKKTDRRNYLRKYYLEHKNYFKEYYRKRKEKYRLYYIEYRKNNPEIIKKIDERKKLKRIERRLMKEQEGNQEN